MQPIDRFVVEEYLLDVLFFMNGWFVNYIQSCLDQFFLPDILLLFGRHIFYLFAFSLFSVLLIVVAIEVWEGDGSVNPLLVTKSLIMHHINLNVMVKYLFLFFFKIQGVPCLVLLFNRKRSRN